MRDVRERCKGCGTRKEDWAADPLAYVGDIEICPGCVVISEEEQNVGDQKGAHIRLVTRAEGLARVARGEGIGAK